MGKIASFLAGLFSKYFGDSVKKAAIFAVYLVVLTTVLNGVKDFVLANVDVSSFMTPTICYFLTQLHAFSLLAAYFAFMSSNWLKSKIVRFWSSSGNN